MRMDRSIKVLLVEDNVTDALVARDELLHAVGVVFAVEHFERLQSALDLLAEQKAGQEFDVILLDLNLPDSEGLATFKRLAAAAPSIPTVVLSHRDDEGLALQALEAGAQDYLVKGQAEGLLVRAIRYAIQRRQAEETLLASQRQLQNIIDSGQSLIYTLDLEGRITLANESLEALLGVPKGGLLGKTRTENNAGISATRRHHCPPPKRWARPAATWPMLPAPRVSRRSLALPEARLR